ncbi:MAG: 50S ribosomal protein L3 [Candidatus Pacearchaeota archaeon]|nr:50S ribosomal protein L3 [Candidatus Pacearchaeota archaeon]
MAKKSQPRAGSLQYWPRKRIYRFLPSVNWKVIDAKGLKGFIAYKVGMATSLVKDSTSNSLTKDKKMFLPVSILEIPPMKIISVRFYKNNQVVNEVLSLNLSKELKHVLKMPKTYSKKIEDIKDYEDLKIIVYSEVEKTGIKKTPDLTEIGLGGTLEEKLAFVKEKLGKEILFSDIFKDVKLVDVRGLTKGRGLAGPMKRFGIKRRQHKSEKGVRRPGTLGPWHPNHVVFRVPMSGQLGLFTRVTYNSKILSSGKIQASDINKKEGWMHYGKIKTEYLIVKGSIQGPAKRQLLLTQPLRPTKSQEKLNYEFLGLK